MAENDNKTNIVTVGPNGQLVSVLTLEHLKNEYIVDCPPIEDLAKKYNLPVATIESFIEKNNLENVRKAHVKHGLAKLQNVQIAQAEKLMDLETKFKKMRIVQLEKLAQDYLAYYAKYGHFYKIHPITGEILKDTNGIPMQLKIPNITKEVMELKESVSISEGLKNLLGLIDTIINKKQGEEPAETIDTVNYGGIFEKRRPESE